jgi:hypothetical protein
VAAAAVHNVVRSAAALAAGVLAAVALAGCTTQPLPAGPSDGDVARYYAAVSDARWNSLGLGPAVERPVITNARPIAREVWATRVADCMNGAGFANYSEQGGGLTVLSSDGLQATEEKVALYMCQELYPVESDATAVFSVGQLRYVYRYYTSFLVPCLESRGYDIGDVPPRDAFLDQGNLGVWNPYWSGTTWDTDTLAALRSHCPPMPPGIPDPFGE